MEGSKEICQKGITMPADQVSVTYINNDGGGFPETVSVNRGTTLEQFLSVHGVPEPDNYVVTVNRQVEARNYQLSNGDRISATPRNLKAAA
jgi:sulfur carrier protein ThiS